MENTNRKDYKFLKGDDFNWADLVPDGWLNLFYEMCEKLEKILIKHDFLDDFEITDVKEKYGELRVYHNCGIDEVEDLILDYEDKSRNICIICGKSLEGFPFGCPVPICVKCIRKL